ARVPSSVPTQLGTGAEAVRQSGASIEVGVFTGAGSRQPAGHDGGYELAEPAHGHFVLVQPKTAQGCRGLRLVVPIEHAARDRQARAAVVLPGGAASDGKTLAAGCYLTSPRAAEERRGVARDRGSKGAVSAARLH